MRSWRQPSAATSANAASISTARRRPARSSAVSPRYGRRGVSLTGYIWYRTVPDMGAPLSVRARSVAAQLTDLYPSIARPLAEPPSGSGLRPVMGEGGPPIVGRSFSAFADSLGSARRRYERFGPVSWTNIIGTRLVMVLGPDGIGEVLTNRDRTFANKEGWEYAIGPFFHRGVMLMDFEEHRHHRLIMQQAFKRERLSSYLDAMNPAIAQGVSHWKPSS